MPKVVTLRLSDEEYRMISSGAEAEHRPISNFITAVVLRNLEEACHTDSIETAQIRLDQNLLKKLEAGHSNSIKKKGRCVG